jgi:TPR repeat protein
MHEVKPEQAKQNLRSALKLLGMLAFAALAPFSFAQSTVGAMSPGVLSASNPNIVPAIPELSPSSAEAEAIFKLASRLEVGDATVARDDALARRLYRIAADAGHAGAQCNLGAMLMDGTGGPTDLAGGAALFRKAALRGHGLAQYNLGVMHALGDGVIKDSGEAMAWIEQAITRLPEGDAMTSAKAWREHLRNRMSSREGMIARNRSQELGEAVVRELAAASTGSASRAARSAVRSGLDELGLSAEALKRLGLAPSGAALAANAATALMATAPSPSIATKTIPSINGDSAPPTVPVETALQEWLRAWSERRADDYLDFYDARYAPLGGVDRAVWAKRRRAAIRHPNWVKVRAEQVSTTEMSPEEFVVGFVQVYSASTGHRETTRKSMIWRWNAGHWRIVSEQAAAASAKADREAEAAALPVTPPVSIAVAPVLPVDSSAPNAAAFEPAVRAWVKAWGDRQVDAYLAFYASSFEVPGGQDRATWAAERRDSTMRPAWIKVRADRLKTSVNGDLAEARFFQVYVVAPGTVELVNKSMRWVWSDGRWQIVQEHSEPLVGKHGRK